MAVHVRIIKPLELRKDVLETAIVSTDAIKSSSNLTEILKQKKRIRTQMVNLIKNIKKDIKRFEKKLPTIPEKHQAHAKRDTLHKLMEEERTLDLGGEVKSVEKVKEEIDRIKGKKTISRKRLTAIQEKEKLKNELDSIRGRISRLNRLLPNE
jgi:hypothetical protein|tara:strand:- start:86 stop:544 length:459 start_codon:yes stop_codon:yes gene_type:complete